MAARKKKKLKSRREIREKKKNGNGGNKIYLKAILIFATILLVVRGVLSFNTKYWEKDNKLSLAVKSEGQDVKVLVFDPEVEKITTIIIPSDTEVEVSRQLGVMKIKNVWQLGINEKLDGELLAETVTKNFKIPVVTWAGSFGEGFSSANYIEKVKATILPYKTNLSLGDKIMIGIFSFNVKDFKHEEINLKNTTFLQSKTLNDGGEGYVVTGKIPKSLIIIMSDNLLAKESARLSIIDATGKGGLAEEFGEIIESMGAKVTSVKEVEKEDVGCIVVGEDEKISERIAIVFDCEVENDEKPQGNFDIQITIGEDFARRF